jgi:hypothetical protein
MLIGTSPKKESTAKLGWRTFRHVLMRLELTGFKAKDVVCMWAKVTNGAYRRDRFLGCAGFHG